MAGDRLAWPGAFAGTKIAMPALKDLLEGKPVRAPLHPALVHLPIALFPLSVVFDAASRLVQRGNLPLTQAAFVTLIAGLATALFAAIFGFVDYTDIRDDHPGKKTATLHMGLNLVAVGLFAVSAGLRYSDLAETKTPVGPFVLSLIGLAVLSYAGYLGGVLVYDDGIAVGRHRRQSQLPPTTVVVRTNGQPAAIANESELRSGETLRVEIDGIIAAVVRLDGEIYAFQEFCTHRFGPLSEGAFEGCEVICPWHRSRFDIRTGKVTAGPAKVDLRTFRTAVRDGKIWIDPPGKSA
jgi:nitrite reductase/ring-hydroxylating ferredoxin subunit/uncharacterized membrane protein